MDLFYQGDTLRKYTNKLKKDIQDLAKKENIIIKEKLKLVYGTKDCEGNNLLVIMPPYIKGEYFKSNQIEKLEIILKTYEINNYFLTYSYHLPKDKVTRKDIKTYGFWIKRIIDYVCPKIIVCLGEESMFSLFKRKAILKDYHGQIVGEHLEIPVFLTYPMEYYNEKSQYEDNSYKSYLLKKDWENISKEYKEKVNENI